MFVPMNITTIWCLYMFPDNTHSHVCATRYFGEWEFHHLSDVGKALALYTPSSITFKGWLVHMDEWKKGCLFHISCNNGLQNLVFYETSFLHFQCVHV